MTRETTRRLIAAGVVTVIVVLVAVLAAGSTHRTRVRRAAPPAPPPVAITPSQLPALAAAVGHPVYWTGSRTKQTLGVSRASNGNVLLRYLPAGVSVDTRAQDYLTIGSYPVADAFAQVRAGARRPGARTASAPNGGLVLVPPEHAESAYVAYPGSHVLIEVYSPDPARSLKVALSPRLRPVP